MYTKTSEAGFGSAVIIGLIAAALLGGGVYYVSMDKEPDPALMVTADTSEMMDETKMGDGDMDSEQMGDEMADGDAKMEDDMQEEIMKDEMDDDMMKKEPIATNVESDVSLVAGSYENYSADKLALAAGGDVVLFFHASWCPSCRGLDADIQKNLSNIPAGTHILKVDYDSATDLKKKYGVVRQHTLVQVDETGAKLQTLTGLTNTLSQVVGQI